MKDLKACKICSFLTKEDMCPQCNEPTSKEWQGYLVVTDCTKSEIAKKMGINVNGNYALKVR